MEMMRTWDFYRKTEGIASGILEFLASIASLRPLRLSRPSGLTFPFYFFHFYFSLLTPHVLCSFIPSRLTSFQLLPLTPQS